jgi:hypothetical protein
MLKPDPIAKSLSSLTLSTGHRPRAKVLLLDSAADAIALAREIAAEAELG